MNESPRGANLLAIMQGGEYRHDFRDWLADNFHIWAAFERAALAVWDRGRKHYSAQTIVELLRHESVLREAPGSEWKINNNVRPDLARLFMAVYPECAGFFETRERKAETT